MHYVGVDLAWGQRAATGIAVLDAAGRLLTLDTVTTDAQILHLLDRHAADEVLVAFDAPLVVMNDAGMRECEKQVARTFGRFGIGCHAAHRGMTGFADGGRAARIAQAAGLDPAPWSTEPRRAVEVYPHPAIVQLFGLPRALRYKHKPGRDLDLLRAELTRLLDLLESLEDAGPALHLTQHEAWQGTRRRVAAATRKVHLRREEDAVDAVVCAYVALLAHQAPDSVRVLGAHAADGGYLLTPVDPGTAAALDAAGTATTYPVPRPT